MPAAIIDYFPLSNKSFLRYGLWKTQAQNCLGTVIILADYGDQLEDRKGLITQICARNFDVASFDWFAQETPQAEKSGILPAPMSDFRVVLQNWKEIFLSFFLTRLPSPFYGLGMGAGALLGLAAHSVFQSQMRRMLLVSPLLAPHGREAGGLFHVFSRFMGDLGLEGWRTNKPLVETVPQLDPITMARQAKSGYVRQYYPTLGCYQGLLDAAQFVLSSETREKISIPLLCVLSSTDKISKALLARQFCNNLRCASAITLRHADRFPFEGDAAHTRQFWRAFDVFIPGTGAPDPNRSLENGLII